MHIERIYTLDQLDEIVELLSSLMNDCRVVTFTGPLGAGKTTLIKKFLAGQGVKELVTSPTFTTMNRYTTEKGHIFYHFDLYRLTSRAEFHDAGLDEYLYQPNSWALIEWPELVIPLLTHSVCSLSLDYVSESERSLVLSTK